MYLHRYLQLLGCLFVTFMMQCDGKRSIHLIFSLLFVLTKMLAILENLFGICQSCRL